MRHSAIVLLLGITASLVTTDAFSQRRGRGRNRGSDPANYCWLTDYNEAKRVARNNDEPLMVVFRCVP